MTPFFLRSIISLFISIVLFRGFFAGPVFALEYQVPNSGSPYLNLSKIKENRVLHLPTGTQVTVEQLIASIEGSRVIYIGETHDNLEAHRVQLEIIRRIFKKFPNRVAMGMEMFRRPAQEKLDLWNEGRLSEKEFKKLFRNNWGHGYKLYQPIFDFSRQNSIPILGLKSSLETEARLRSEDYSPGSGMFPDMDLKDPYHKAYSMSVFGGHGEQMQKPYQMLLLWEETMAQTVAEFLNAEKYRDWKLIVLTGGFHVQYGFGVPKRAFRRTPHSYSIILPTVTHIPEELKDREMDVDPVAIPLYAADFVWRVPYKVPPKNKIKLGVILREQESGVMVTSVSKNSNADRAEILKGDVLLNMDGGRIEDIGEMVERLQEKNFGERVRLRVLRGSTELELEVLFKEPGQK